MTVYLYFSLIPEALIASNLPPEKFGQYYATGSSYKSKGQCLFFAVDINFRSDYFAIDEAIARCVPTADGTPKHSVYVSVYRVLEHLPVSALGKLYLTTAYGHTLGLERGAMAAQKQGGLHLYRRDYRPTGPWRARSSRRGGRARWWLGAVSCKRLILTR